MTADGFNPDHEPFRVMLNRPVELVVATSSDAPLRLGWLSGFAPVPLRVESSDGRVELFERRLLQAGETTLGEAPATKGEKRPRWFAFLLEEDAFTKAD